MAIDSSIWIYQFQATMRDKDGRALSNAHVLGFLRRISKLLFYGIKPVFVFDGGAPVLKRATLVRLCYYVHFLHSHLNSTIRTREETRKVVRLLAMPSWQKNSWLLRCDGKPSITPTS